MRTPLIPTQAPTGSTPAWVAITATLAALAGLAGNGADFHDAVIDLGDFILKQAAQEIAMRAGKDDLRARASFLDLQTNGADAVVNLETLAGDLLLAGMSLRPSYPGRWWRPACWWPAQCR